MKMRCFLINKDNVRTFQLLQSRFKLQLNTLFYMGKMNLLHISCDTGWAGLAAELVNNQVRIYTINCFYQTLYSISWKATIKSQENLKQSTQVHLFF